MPEKQFVVNNKNYSLSFGDGQEEQLDQLVALLNSRIAPYAESYSEYSESYLMLLLSLELADELNTLKQQGSSSSDPIFENRIKELAIRADGLVKKAQA